MQVHQVGQWGSIFAGALLLLGCANHPPESENTPTAPATAQATPAQATPAKKEGSYYYECADGYHFRATFAKTDLAQTENQDEATVELPERYLTLTAVPAASGIKYNGDEATFWSKGDEATVELRLESGTTLHTQCHVSKEPTVDFEARGNEPGWTLRMDSTQRITFVGDYGDKTAIVPMPQPVKEASHKTTRWHAQTATNDLVVVAQEKSCTDSMTDQLFPASVTVTLNGKEYQGCGGGPIGRP